MSAFAAHPELLRRLIDDHLPAHIRLPADFLVWTQVNGDGAALFSCPASAEGKGADLQLTAPAGERPVR